MILLSKFYNAFMTMKYILPSFFLLLLGCQATSSIDPLVHQKQTIDNIKVTAIADDLPGFEIYNNQGCVNCHGDMLQGGLQGPPLIFPMYKIGSHSDARLHISIKKGVKQDHWYFGDMPAYPDLTDTQVQHLVDFINASIKLNDI